MSTSMRELAGGLFLVLFSVAVLWGPGWLRRRRRLRARRPLRQMESVFSMRFACGRTHETTYYQGSDSDCLPHVPFGWRRAHPSGWMCPDCVRAWERGAWARRTGGRSGHGTR